MKYSPDEFRYTTENGYTRILSDSYFPDDTTPGYPELQVHYLTLILPPNKKVISYQIDIQDFIDITTEDWVYPVQENIPTDGTPITWTNPDPDIYNSSEWYPGQMIQYLGSGIFDGAILATFKVYPMRYLPTRGILRLATTMSISLTLGDTVINVPVAMVRGEECQKWYDAYLNSVVYNKSDITSYYPRPTIVPESELWPDYYTIPPLAPYLIITNSQLLQSLIPLQDWFIKKGIPAAIAKTSDIYAHYPGTTREQKIRNYLIDAYSTAGLTFVLIVGDTSVVPAKYCDVQYLIWRDTIPTDVYYSDLSSEWYGPSCYGYDWHGEVFVGRIAVKSTESSLVENYINKYFTFNFNPPNADLSYHALWLFSEFPICTTQVKPLYPDYFVHHYGPNITGAQTEDSLSVGYMWASVYAHGWSHGWWTNTQQPPSSFLSNFTGGSSDGNVPSLTNYNKFFLLYSISCNNAQYDYPYPQDTCMANAMVHLYPDPQPKAAIAFLGNTRKGFLPPSPSLHKGFARAYFRGIGPVHFYPTIGYAEVTSKSLYPYNRYVHFSHNLFGSPDVYVWTRPPQTMRLGFAHTIPLKPQEYTVSVKASNGRPLRGVKVTLYKPDGAGIYPDVYQTGYTGRDGTVTFFIDPSTMGMMYITATDFARNHLPARDSCYVGEPPPWKSGEMASSSSYPNVLDISVKGKIISGKPRFIITLPSNSYAEISVYNSVGQEVYSDKKHFHRGKTDYTLNRDLSSGVYWIKLKTKHRQVLKKFLVIR